VKYENCMITGCASYKPNKKVANYPGPEFSALLRSIRQILSGDDNRGFLSGFEGQTPQTFGLGYHSQASKSSTTLEDPKIP